VQSLLAFVTASGLAANAAAGATAAATRNVRIKRFMFVDLAFESGALSVEI
jgi:hypothetical protein